jgi:hypothetical protein
VRDFFDKHAKNAKPDAKELDQRNRESGLPSNIKVYERDPSLDVLSDSHTWVSFEDEVPALKSYKDGTLYSLSLGEGGAAAPSGNIAFRSSSTATSTTGAVISTPAGVVLDDIMLAFVCVSGSGATITPPSGWTLLTRTDNSTTVSLATYWKAASASEPATTTWGLGGLVIAITILAYSGVNASPVETYNTDPGGTSGTSPASPAVTTSLNNCLIIRAYAVAVLSAGASVNITPPTGYTNRGQAAFSNASYNGYTAEASDLLQPTAGVSGSATATASATVSHTSQTIALKP